MLQRMRSGVGSWAAKIILGILVLSFAGWGIQDYASTDPDGGNVAAEVGGQEIGIRQLERAYRTELRRRGLQSVDPETAREMGLAQRVLDRLVRRGLFDAETDALGLSATDAMVRREIEGQQQFRNQFGEFDRDLFRRTLRAAGMTEQAFVESVRRDLARQQLLGTISAGAVPSQPLVDALFTYHGATRSARAVRVPRPPASEIAAPGDSTLRSYYESNRERFKQPALRELSYIHLAPQAVLDQVSVPDEEIRAAYESRKDAYTKPEKRTLRQMLLPDEETARRAAELVDEGESFEAAARAVADIDPETLELGTFTREEIPDETLAETAFALEEGAVSEPVQGNFGWFLVEVTDVARGEVTPLSEVRAEIRRDLALDRAIDIVYDLSKEIDQAFGEGLTLEETAERIGLSVKTVDAVSREGKDRQGEKLDGLPPGVSFLETAFSTPEGELSFLEETADNGYFVLRVDDVIEPQVPPLADIRERVAEAWRERARTDAAEERAKALREEARMQGSLAGAAESQGLAVESVTGFGRDGSGAESDLPRQLARELFGLTVGDVAYGPAGETGEGYVVAEVTDKTPASEAAAPELAENLADSLSAGLEAGMIDSYGGALRERHEITINDQVVERVY